MVEQFIEARVKVCRGKENLLRQWLAACDLGSEIDGLVDTACNGVNGLDKLLTDLQPQAPPRRQALGLALDRQRAAVAFDDCMAPYAGQSPKAAAGMVRDREVWVVLYACPAEPFTGPYRRHPGADLQAGKEISESPYPVSPSNTLRLPCGVWVDGRARQIYNVSMDMAFCERWAWA